MFKNYLIVAFRNFQEKQDFSLLNIGYITGMGLIILIAIITTGSQIIRIARTNPVKNLHTE